MEECSDENQLQQAMEATGKQKHGKRGIKGIGRGQSEYHEKIKQKPACYYAYYGKDLSYLEMRNKRCSGIHA